MTENFIASPHFFLFSLLLSTMATKLMQTDNEKLLDFCICRKSQIIKCIHSGKVNSFSGLNDFMNNVNQSQIPLKKVRLDFDICNYSCSDNNLDAKWKIYLHLQKSQQRMNKCSITSNRKYQCIDLYTRTNRINETMPF